MISIYLGYSDIAIYIDNNSTKVLNNENTIKNIYIDNISFPITPVLGKLKLYQKNIKDFGKCTYSDSLSISDRLDFSVIKYDYDINENNIFAYDASLPLTLGYYNQNIKENFLISDTNNKISIDGSLLERCHVNLSDIEAKVCFNINIINNLDEHFVCPFSLLIPLNDSNNINSIYNGYFLYESDNLNMFRFYKL